MEKRIKGKYGLRIKNYQAGSVYSYNLGVRNNYDNKDAMLTNSMFLNYMKEHGLNVYKEDSTRDIICLDFKYGSRSYNDEIKHLRKTTKEVEKNGKLSDEQKQIKLEALRGHMEEAEKNRDKFDKKSADQIRTIFYNNGVDIEYHRMNKQKEWVLDEIIHYKMLYRTPGKAKVGKCMFCREELYDVAHEYLYMGMSLPEENAPIVEVGAYSSLITSTIDIRVGDQGRIAIAPEEIIILKDVKSFVNSKIISVETNENKHCFVKDIDEYPVMNEMFDGQALIDSSIFPKEGNGYILLRQHFTKCAAFCTHIQKFFRDHYGDAYEDAYIEDMFGRQVRAKDIKMITTDNAIKWLKFDIDFDYWAEWVHKSDNMWGIVKTAHPSKFGEVQRMSYQMVNALDINRMDEVCQRSIDYIYDLRTDDEAFLQYLRDNSNFSNDFEVLVALVEQDRDFLRCDYFKERRRRIVDACLLNLKTGKVIQNADNLVIVGSPYAMLMHSVGEDALQDPTFDVEDDAIQCWTSRFADNEYLAEFRSPFNSLNGLGHLHNVHDWRFDKYFELGDLCIAVNMNHTTFQPRNNGSDQDSDSIYVTNFKPIVEHAKFCQENHPTVVNNIPQEKNHYDSSLNSFADVDNRLAASQLSIGMSSNLAQVALSYSYNFKERKYYDAVCILACLAQVSIDSAKKSYDMDLMEEIKRMKRLINIDKNKYPLFWIGIRRGFNKQRINTKLKCPMNYLFNINAGCNPVKEKTIPLSKFFVKTDLKSHQKGRKSYRIEKMIQDYSYDLSKNFYIDNDLKELEADAYYLMIDKFDQLVSDLRNSYISKNYAGFMSWLIDRAFIISPKIASNRDSINSQMNRNRSLLLKVLYEINPDVLLSCFSKNISSAN